MDLLLLSTNVARPRVIAQLHGEDVLSGIAKKSVTAASVFVGATNIEGDEQADLSVHGGTDKAVYAYPTDHWPWWQSEHGLRCAAGLFGENLTLHGGDETKVRIGDRFGWGEVVLEVSEPRAPCFKFAIHANRPDAPSLLTHSGRCGWYLRVIVEGTAPARDVMLTRIETDDTAPTVREVFTARFDPSVSLESRRRAALAPKLAQTWRQSLEKRLSGKL